MIGCESEAGVSRTGGTFRFSARETQCVVGEDILIVISGPRAALGGWLVINSVSIVPLWAIQPIQAMTLGRQLAAGSWLWVSTEVGSSCYKFLSLETVFQTRGAYQERVRS